MVLSFLVWCLIPILGTVAASQALSYPTPVDFDGRLSRWNIDREGRPLLYAIESDNEEVLSTYQFIIEDAAGLWSSVTDAYVELQLAEEEDSPDIVIKLQKELEDAPFSAGYSIVTGYQDDGSLKSCEIYIAAQTGFSFRAIGKTALHELGHCLGLGHSLIPEAIMSYRLDKNQYGLDIDDEAALSRLYPMDGSPPKLPPGCSAGTGHKPQSRTNAIILLCLMLCPAGLSQWPAFDRSRPLP